MKKLDQIGSLDNTIIIYTSDHGSYRHERNGNLHAGKGSLMEGGTRTPGIIHWPRRDDPTLRLESAGKTIPIELEELDALAVSPALVGKIPEKSRGLKLGLKDGSLLQLRELPTSDLAPITSKP